MALTKALVQTQFRAARTALSGSNVSVRHEGHTYTGVRSSTEFSDQPGGMGSLQGASGAVRLDVSELNTPYPKAGDEIDVIEQDGSIWKERRVIMPRYDQTGGTVRIDYENRY